MFSMRLSVVYIVFFIASVSCFSKPGPAPFPADIEGFEIEAATDLLRKATELPVGAYTDQENRVILTGHQKGMNVSILFGPLGVLAANQANKSGGKAASEDLGISVGRGLVSLVQGKVEAALSELRGSSRMQLGSEVKLRLCPYLSINRTKDQLSKVFVMCIVELAVPGEQKPIWRCVFFAEVEGEFSDVALQGDEGLAQAIDASADHVAWALRKAIDMDFSQYTQQAVKARFPWLRNAAFPLGGFVMDEKDDYKLYRMPFGIWQGYIVMLNDSVELKPLKKLKDKYREDFSAAVQ